jgi:hypothetical protein
MPTKRKRSDPAAPPAGAALADSHGALGDAAPTGTDAIEALPAEAANTQRSVSFGVTLLLNPDNSVARTRVAYTPPEGEEPGKPKQWTGWDPERLAQVIVERGGLNIPLPAAAPPPAKPPPPPIDPEQAAREALAAAVAPAPRPTPRLRRLALLRMPQAAPQHIVAGGTPHQLGLEIDLSELQCAGEQYERYAVKVYAKQLGSGKRQLISEARGALGDSNVVAFTTHARALPRGLYRLEAELELTAPTAQPRPPRNARLRGDLVYFY